MTRLDRLGLKHLKLSLELLRLERAGWIESMSYAHVYMIREGVVAEMRRLANGVDS